MNNPYYNKLGPWCVLVIFLGFTLNVTPIDSNIHLGLWLASVAMFFYLHFFSDGTKENEGD